MANVLYDPGREGILDESIGMNTGDIRATLLLAGIAGAEAFGGADLAALIGGAGQITSAEAFGQPLVYDPAAPWNIVDAGGIASAEAFGQPTLGTQSAATPVPYWTTSEVYIPPDRPMRINRLRIVHIVGVGGIESAEAVGIPTVTLDAMHLPRAVREEEWLLRRAA